MLKKKGSAVNSMLQQRSRWAYFLSWACSMTKGKNVKESIDGFVGDAEQFDDITMLAFRYNGK